MFKKRQILHSSWKLKYFACRKILPPAKKTKKNLRIFSTTFINRAYISLRAFTQLFDLLKQIKKLKRPTESEKLHYDATIAFSAPLWASNVTIDFAASFYHKFRLLHLSLRSSNSFSPSFLFRKRAGRIMLERGENGVKMELRLIGLKLLEVFGLL